MGANRSADTFHLHTAIIAKAQNEPSDDELRGGRHDAVVTSGERPSCPSRHSYV